VDFSPYSAVDKDSANIRKEEEIQKKTQWIKAENSLTF
jgi:hypothetical protein